MADAAPKKTKLDLILAIATLLSILGFVAVMAGWFKVPPSAALVKGVSPGQVDAGSQLYMGDGSEKFAVVEFFDYECGPCRAVAPGVEEVVKNSGGKVALKLQNFPLTMHPHAEALARISVSLTSMDTLKAFHDPATTQGNQSLDRLILDWDAKLDKTSPGWKDRADTALEVSRKAADSIALTGTPTIIFVDYKNGTVYRCPEVNSLKALVASKI